MVDQITRAHGEPPLLRRRSPCRQRGSEPRSWEHQKGKGRWISRLLALGYVWSWTNHQLAAACRHIRGRR
jgi:hypothetical protein